jgi:hypothetical protein
VKEFLARHPEWLNHADLLAVPPNAKEVVEEFSDAAGCSLLDDEHALATDGSTRLALYVRLRREGKDHRWADMLASQRAPRGCTDDTFFSGLPRLAEQFDSDRAMNRCISESKKRGYTPGANDVYQPGLARFPGDPEAFVNRTRGRGYIKSLCEKRGWACNGAVNVEAREPESDPYDPKNCVPMHKNLVDSYARDMVKANPDLKRKSRAEIKELVLDKHGPTK